MKKTVKSKPKKLSVASTPVKYEKDFVEWTKNQTKFLRRHEFEKLDITNLIEEIESLGRSDRRALRSQVVRLLLHLLKKEYQPEGQGNSRSWVGSILNAKHEIKVLITDSPSLRKELEKIYPDAYEDAKLEAAAETDLDITKFPEISPWSIEDILPFTKSKKKH